jgi:hypothetical protein
MEVGTAHRYITEVIGLLAERAPDLRQALRKARCSPSRLTTIVHAILTLSYQGT